MNQIGPTLITVVGGIVALAMVAVVVSQKAQTSTILTGAGTALSTVINAAVSPLGSNQFGSTGTAIGGASH
jgi:PRD1 phage membrane DNA delivery